MRGCGRAPLDPAGPARDRRRGDPRPEHPEPDPDDRGALRAPLRSRRLRFGPRRARPGLRPGDAGDRGARAATCSGEAVLPAILAPLIVQASLALGAAMLLESGLSFIGLGAQAADAKLGLDGLVGSQQSWSVSAAGPSGHRRPWRRRSSPSTCSATASATRSTLE